MESCVKCARVMEASGHELNAGGDQVNEESWRQYIAQHGFGDAWDDSNHRTEQDRYGAIVAHLAASQEHRMAEQRDFVREKEQWTLLMRRSADCLERHRAAVEGIMELADKVQLEWAEKKALEDRHAQQRATCSNDWPRLFSEKKVRIGDWTDEDTKELTIVSTMFDPRYYLGHPGGDYIFRYSDEGDTTNLEAPCPMASTPETAWDTWESPEWDSILESDSEELPRRLQYCGQVPRPLQEYTGRLKVLVPAIAQIIVSLVGFHRANGESEPLSRELQELAGLDSTSSRADFNKLRLLWISEFPEEDGRAPTDIRGRLQRSAKVLEFAHLVTKIIADGVPTALEELASLLAVLKRSTGWRLSKMHRIECERVERRALHELLHEKEFEHLLVFEDPGFKHDIHAFYRARRFEADPLHPSRRYKCRDVSAQLEQSLFLRRFGWIENESEPETTSPLNPTGTAPQIREDDFDDSSTYDSDDEDYSSSEEKPEEEEERPAKRACHTAPAQRVTAAELRRLLEPLPARGVEYKGPGHKRNSTPVRGRSGPARKPLQPINGNRQSARVLESIP